MNLFSPLVALAWQHYRPQVPAWPMREIARGHDWLLEHFNAGGRQHGLLAWSLGALLPALLAGLLVAALGGLFGPLGWAAEVLLLYCLFGFRATSFHAASVARALQADELTRARATLSEWNAALAPADGKDDMLRQTLEEILKSALYRLFGVLFWYWLAGVAGALLYALSQTCCERWHGDVVFAHFARRVTFWMDWLPARALAFSFAIVGNFQDATESWRSQAEAWPDANEGVILAAGAGALGIRLGGPLRFAETELPRPELGTEEPADTASVDAAVALVWRAALLWLSVVGLLWLGRL